jgi:hypothetical protein
MKNNFVKIVALSVILLLFSSCSKEKKPEFVDNQTSVPEKKGEVTNPETKQDTKQESSDSSKLRSEELSNPDSKKYKRGNETPEATISPLEAEEYNGKYVTVKGFVADIYQSEKVAYLNFVEKFPNNPFTAVIFASKFADFPDISKYRNKNVEVTGRVSKFKDKPQIILNDPKQIKVN